MSHGKFAIESKLYLDLAQWLGKGEALAKEFREHGVALPAPLLRLVEDDAGKADEAGDDGPRLIIPPPPLPVSAPPGMRQGWIWLPVVEMTPFGLVRAILRTATEPMPVKDVISAIVRLGVEDQNGGSVANIGTRLESRNMITRAKDGWLASAKYKEDAAVLHEEFAWGPAAVFEKHELSAYRRHCILYVMRLHADGFQVMQLTRLLGTCKWMHAPLSQDAIKLDIMTLDKEGKVKRIGGTAKWKAAA